MTNDEKKNSYNKVLDIFLNGESKETIFLNSRTINALNYLLYKLLNKKYTTSFCFLYKIYILEKNRFCDDHIHNIFLNVFTVKLIQVRHKILIILYNSNVRTSTNCL